MLCLLIDFYSCSNPNDHLDHGNKIKKKAQNTAAQVSSACGRFSTETTAGVNTCPPHNPPFFNQIWKRGKKKPQLEH